LSDIAEKLLRDERFIKSVAVEIAKNREFQYLILEAAIKNVATKEDIQMLKEDIRDLKRCVDVRIGDVDKRIDGLGKRIDSLDKRINLLQWVMLLGFSIFSVILSILTFMISTLLAR